jgi:cytochrome c oxidase subunit 4
MTTHTTEHTAASHGDSAHGGAEHAEHGMSTRGYINIALILAAITALEVSTYYVDFGPLFLPALLIMMVVSYFMHLKFDNKLFSWMFYAGLFLAVGVYVAALGTFHFFLR